MYWVLDALCSASKWLYSGSGFSGDASTVEGEPDVFGRTVGLAMLTRGRVNDIR